MIANHGPCRPHPYQDARYGTNNRVMNPASVKGKLMGWRCTVCAPPKVHSARRGGVFDEADLRVVRK